MLVNSELDGPKGVKTACKETALRVPVSRFKRERKKTPYITLPQEAADKHATDKRKSNNQRFAEDDV